MEVLVALGAGNLTIGPIHCDSGSASGATLTGRKDRGHVRINPAHDVVDTAIHELIHRMRPKWSERKVRAETAKLMRDLDDAAIDRLYALILTVAKVRKRALLIESD